MSDKPNLSAPQAHEIKMNATERHNGDLRLAVAEYLFGASAVKDGKLGDGLDLTLIDNVRKQCKILKGASLPAAKNTGKTNPAKPAKSKLSQKKPVSKKKPTIKRG